MAKVVMRFDKARKITIDAVEKIVRKVAYDVEAEAKDRAPVDTGKLKNSISVEKKGDLSYWVAPHTDYAIYQELGTRYIRGKHYMRNGAKAVARKFSL